MFYISGDNRIYRTLPVKQVHIPRIIWSELELHILHVITIINAIMLMLNGIATKKYKERNKIRC